MLWREVAARATLDALGYTGITDQPSLHDRMVSAARNWFRFVGDAREVFVMAGVDLDEVREGVLGVRAIYSEDWYE